MSAAQQRRSLISIEAEKSQEESIDPDEYLWETLPGRCCFLADEYDCDMCNVWSDPQNFCHTSKESCELCGESAASSSVSHVRSPPQDNLLEAATFRVRFDLSGMSLYCPAPPPLLNADKVCTDDSRVGMGCNDDLDTGLCSRSGALASCQAACRQTQHCEMIVLYTDSMAGSCVLW